MIRKLIEDILEAEMDAFLDTRSYGRSTKRTGCRSGLHVRTLIRTMAELQLRWLYDRRDLQEACGDLAAWLEKWQEGYPKLCEWVEGNIDQTLSFYRLSRQHHNPVNRPTAWSG